MPTKQMPIMQTRAEFKPGTYDAEKRTIDVCFTTGAKGLRRAWTGDYYEELEVSESAMRMDRLNSGAPVLNTHSQWDLRDIIGVVERAWVEKGEGYATIRFSEREEIQGLIRDITTGIIRNLSVGYRVHTYEEIGAPQGEAPTYRATDWEPLELSFVPVGFDAGAQTRSEQPQETFEVEIITRSAPAAESGLVNQEDKEMGKETQVTTEEVRNIPTVDAEQIRSEERTRQKDIRNLVRIARLSDATAERLIDAGSTVEAARAAIFEEWAAQDTAKTVSAGAQVTRDEGETQRRGMENAILLRVAPGVKLTAEDAEMARNFRGLSLSEMARESLERNGVNVRGLSKREIAEKVLSRSHTTSDFPLILANVANKRLRNAYEAAQTTYQLWARRAPNAPDFKQMSVLQLSGAPELELKAEGAEYKSGTMSESREVYNILTYGKKLTFSREMIINDDLRAFDRVTSAFAASARRLENRLVYTQLTANGKMADGTDLFHADHGNLAGASAISVTSLSEGRGLMRKQKGLGGELINIAPAYLIVPAALEQLAYQYTSTQFVPAKSSDINEFRSGGRTALEPIVEPVLDANSTSKWYLAADNNVIDTVEYCYLDGSEGAYLESEMDFNTDGMSIKARLDFATKVIDHRGLFRNG